MRTVSLALQEEPSYCMALEHTSLSIPSWPAFLEGRDRAVTEDAALDLVHSATMFFFAELHPARVRAGTVSIFLPVVVSLPHQHRAWCQGTDTYKYESS